MTASIPRLMKTAIAAFLVLLGTMGTGGVRHPAPITWEANGVRLAELDLPLTGDGVSFKVGEYLLEGREGSGRSSRQFRDRMILTTQLTGRESPLYRYVVHGYIHGTYGNDPIQALRLHGRMKPPTGNQGEALMIGRMYPVGHGAS